MIIKKHDRDSYYLRQALAHGETDDGDEFTVAINIDGGCLVFTFPEAAYTIELNTLVYAAGLNTLVEEVLEFRKTNTEEEPF